MTENQPRRMVRVLVVDDSAFARSVLSLELASDPEIEVIGHAGDGVQALELVRALRPDVVTLDISMPRMDGLETLERLMAEMPTPVVMVSALTREGADITLEALDKGAVDFILKPVRGGVPLLNELAGTLCAKVKLAASVRRPAPARWRKSGRETPAPPASPKLAWRERVVVMGASTGGPQALAKVLPALPAEARVPILVVQHMPKGFTAALAQRLADLSQIRVEEARPGMRLAPGLAILAAGGRHMTVSKMGTVQLDDGPLECGVRPSLNVTMESVVAAYGAATLGVVLTGMGSDGTRGSGLIKAAGGEVIAEAPETAVIYGMPRSVVEAGYADHVVPLTRVADEIVRRCTRPE